MYGVFDVVRISPFCCLELLCLIVTLGQGLVRVDCKGSSFHTHSIQFHTPVSLLITPLCNCAMSK